MDGHTGTQNNQISLTPLFDFGLMSRMDTVGLSWVVNKTMVTGISLLMVLGMELMKIHQENNWLFYLCAYK